MWKRSVYIDGVDACFPFPRLNGSRLLATLFTLGPVYLVIIPLFPTIHSSYYFPLPVRLFYFHVLPDNNYDQLPEFPFAIFPSCDEKQYCASLWKIRKFNVKLSRISRIIKINLMFLTFRLFLELDFPSTFNLKAPFPRYIY